MIVEAGRFFVSNSHDLSVVYQMKFPESGSVLELAKSLRLSIRGQDVVWDRHQGNMLYGIVRTTDVEKKRSSSNKVADLR